jgi:UrcA family protein
MEQGTRTMHALERTFAVAGPRIAQFIIPACVAGLTALAVADSASAADSRAESGVSIVSERIVYRDLDLSTRQGAQALIRRVEAAAHRLCTPSPDPSLYGGPSAAERRCRNEAAARAIARLGSALVSAEYAQQAGARQVMQSQR